MTRLARPAFLLSLLAALALAACAPEPSSSPPTAEPAAAAEAADLAPRIRAEGATGAVPDKLVIQFPRPVFDYTQYSHDFDEGLLTVEPPVDGQLSLQNPNTLFFQPAAGFEPGTRYQVSLTAVEGKDGMLRPAEGSSWSAEFTTPAFEFVRLSLVDVQATNREAQVDLVFTGAVDPQEVRGNARFELVDEGDRSTRVADVRFSQGRESHVVAAYLPNRGLTPGTRLDLVLDEGVRSRVDREIRAVSASASIHFGRAPIIKMVDVYRAESDSGFYLQVICDDEAVEDQYDFGFWDEIRQKYWQVSQRCIPDDELAREEIHFEPRVDFSISPSRGGFRIFGDFTRGDYQLAMNAGLRTVDGGVLPNRFETRFEVPQRRPRVAFVSQGRYLPRDAWQLLPVKHLNVAQAHLAIRHVPPENLIFWMSDDEDETADERESNLIVKKTLPLAGETDVESTSYLDLSTYVPADVRGLLELEVSGGGSSDKARILLTDLHLVAKRTGDGEVAVWALDMHSLEPVKNVDVRLVRKSGFVMAACDTGGQGACRLRPAADDPDPSPPFALVASRADDLTYLKFADLKAEVQEERIAGEPYRGGRKYRASVYTERGVYRPGETAHIAAIVRGEDDAAPPGGMPVRTALVDPRGKTLRTHTLETNDAGYLTLDVPFAAFAATGRYEVRLEVADVQVGRHSFQVEEFVPERMKVEARSDQNHYLLGDEMSVEVAARYLFGGVPKAHRVELSCDLEPADFSPPDNASFHYGVWRPGEGPDRGVPLGTSTGTLDDEGRGMLACPGGGRAGGFAGPARMVARAAVFEAGSGRTTVGRTSVPVHPAEHYVGLSSGAAQVKAGDELVVDGVTVDWGGRRVSGVASVEVELVRLVTEYGWYFDRSSGRWTNRQQQRPVTEERRTVQVTDGKFQVSFKPASDAAAFLVRARAGAARTDLELEGRGYRHWYQPEEGERTPAPGRATWIALHAPEVTTVGDRLTVAFDAPFPGRVLFTAETDTLIASEWQEVEAGRVSWNFRPREFVPNFYLTAFLVKDPHLDGGRGATRGYLPERAFGVASVTIEPTELTHRLALSAPDEVRSNSRLTVELDLGAVATPTYATVAAVDEGILSLTGFESPDPFPDIFTRRALGVDTFETVGWTLLVPPGSPTSTAGGGGLGRLGRVQTVKPVALWAGLLEVPSDGKLTVDFDVPQYRGELRVMAVTAGREKMGHADARVTVRDPLVVQSTLPRFLTLGDDVRVPVFITNASGAARDVEVAIRSSAAPVPGFDVASGGKNGGRKPVEILGDSVARLSLEDGEGGEAVFRLRALAPTGAARIEVEVTSGDLRSAEDVEVPLLAAGPRSRKVQRVALTEGENDLTRYFEGWLPMSEKSTLWVTSQPYADALGHLKHLVRYPYGCIEQTTSSTRPMLFLGHLLPSIAPEVASSGQIEAMVQHGVDRLLSMQTPAGGFAYWPGDTEPVHWGTAYATHLLLEARKLDYKVDEKSLEDALAWMERQIANHYEQGRHTDDWYSKDAEPYMHYVLALAGRARKARIERLIEDIGPRPDEGEAKEWLYMLRAALYLAGDQRFEAELKHPDASTVSDERDNGWTFYSDRRRRGFMLSTMIDLFGRDPSVEPMVNLVAEMLRGRRSGWYTTQELVWGVTGLGKYVEAGAESFEPPVLTAGGRRIAPSPSPTGRPSSDRVWNLARASEYGDLALEVPAKSGGKLWLILTSEGVREDGEVATGGEGLVLTRRYRDAAGEAVELDGGRHALGDLVYVELTLTNSSPERVANLALVDRIPAGWEIENPRLGRGSAPDWVSTDELWEMDHLDLRDDRLEVFGHLDRGKSGTVVYAVRATTAGKFTAPPVEAEAMYDPRIWARQAGREVYVSGPWGP